MTDTAAELSVPGYDRARLLAWMAENGVAQTLSLIHI